MSPSIIKARLLPGLLILIPLTSVQASGAGHGRVSMQGSIIETACVIRMADRFQQVELGNHTMEQLIESARVESIPLNIQLEDCSLSANGQSQPSWQHVQITFEGPSEDGRLFSLQGSAAGLGVEIQDQDGNIAVPGKPMPPGELTPGTVGLHYFTRLKGSTSLLQTGEFFAVIRFKVEYF